MLLKSMHPVVHSPLSLLPHPPPLSSPLPPLRYVLPWLIDLRDLYRLRIMELCGAYSTREGPYPERRHGYSIALTRVLQNKNLSGDGCLSTNVEIPPADIGSCLQLNSYCQERWYGTSFQAFIEVQIMPLPPLTPFSSKLSCAGRRSGSVL
jgi:hypothetical protein